MRVGSWAKPMVAAALAVGCAGPSLDVPGSARLGDALVFEPSGDAGVVPLLFRARLPNAPPSGEPWLFRDDLSDYYQRALRQGEVPTALRERAVPLRFWRDGPDCWLQPSAWLEADVSYTIAYTGVGTLQTIRAAAGTPLARRVFPPAGSRQYGVSVLCMDGVADVPDTLVLQPGGIALRSIPGMAGTPAEGCITLQVDEPLTQPVVAPPLVGGALLDPAPWLPAPAATAADAPHCAVGTAFFGACLEVSDDRALVTAESDDQLWLLSAPVNGVVAARRGTRNGLLRGLEPATTIELLGSVLSSSGQLEAFRKLVTTLPARRHLILNEVLANPLGPEPASEWVELVNDSARPASLADVWLEDAGGHARLPEQELAPGEIALLVGADFRESGLDVAIPPATRRLVLANLGTRGLSNSGEGLLLVGPEGVLSRFPLLAAVHAGRSMARRTLDAADDDPSNFSEHGAPGASPGAANSFDD